MKLLSINNNKLERILPNLFVVLLFVFINPIYALFFCGFLNLTSSRINFRIFSFMFALSFALLYLLKDYNIESGMGQDVNFYITSFQTINDVAWSEIFYRFIN